MTAEIKAAIVIGVLLCLVGIGLFFGYRYADNAAAVSQAVAQKDQAEAVTGNVMKSLAIINTITRANADAKQQADEQSQERIVIIRQVIASDECAKKPVPDAAVKQLREHADKIRSRSNGANTGKPAG